MTVDLPLRAIRTDDEDELLRFARAVSHHFYEDDSDDDLRPWLPVLADCSSFVVEDGDRIVGNFASLPVELSVPGGDPLPCAGVTAVGVSQTHRRRGSLRRLMRAGLDDAVERGQPVAALYASESVIYPRFGYGITAPMNDYRIDTLRTRFLDPVDPRLVVHLDPDDAPAAAAAVVEAVTGTRPGLVTRTPAQWHQHLVSSPQARDGSSARRLVQVPGRGYAAYRVNEGDDEVRLLGLVAVDTEAEQALWQHLFDLDLTARILAPLRPPDDTLPWLVDDRSRLRRTDGAPLYVRLLDVARCLSARTAGVTDGLVLEVIDGDRDQSGRYRWDVGPEGAACSRTDQPADVAVSVQTLAAVWLGGITPSTLHRARQIDEHTSGAVGRLDRIVATAHAPWTPWIF